MQRLSSAEANMSFSAKSGQSLHYYPSATAQPANTDCGTQKREFGSKNAVTLDNNRLIRQTQTGDASNYLYLNS